MGSLTSELFLAEPFFKQNLIKNSDLPLIEVGMDIKWLPLDISMVQQSSEEQVEAGLVERPLCYSAQASITKFLRPGGLKTEIYFLMVLRLEA